MAAVSSEGQQHLHLHKKFRHNTFTNDTFASITSTSTENLAIQNQYNPLAVGGAAGRRLAAWTCGPVPRGQPLAAGYPHRRSPLALAAQTIPCSASCAA